MEELSISVQQASKSYALYRSPMDRLKEAIHPLRKSFHSTFYALQDVSFEVKKGEALGVIGANGSGKSTLLKLLAGVLTPSSGSVSVSGRVTALLELGVGFNPELSGRENIYLSGTIMGLRRHEIAALEDDILSFADIGAFIDQPLKTYSSGMYVRLAFSIATAVKPEVLIVDEALSVGDVAFQARCAQRMRSLIEDYGCTTVLVSHDLTAIKALSRTTLYLAGGRAVELGPSGEVCDRYVKDQFQSSGFFDMGRAAEGESQGADEGESSAPIELPEELCASFRERVKLFRKQSGGAQILFSRLVSQSQRPASEQIELGAPLTLQVYLEALEDLAELVVAFYVKDLNQLEIFGSNNIYEGQPIRNLRAGDRVMVEFDFTNYLRAGGYSIQLIAADGVPTVRYFDWIENALVFTSEVPPTSTRWALTNPPIPCRYRRARPTNQQCSGEAA